MSRLDRYLIRNIFALTAIVALVLVSIYTFVVFVSELGEVGRNGFSAWQLLRYTLLLVPGNAYILLPIIVLLGTLLGVGGMARQGELTAMRGAGVSYLRIGAATLLAGALLGAVAFVLGNWLGPEGQRQADQMRRETGAGPGRSEWLRDDRNVVRIRHLTSADHVSGLTIYTLAADGRLASIIDARDADFVAGHWQLHDVRRSDFEANRVIASHQPILNWQGGITPDVLQLMILKENSLTVEGLFRLVNYLQDNRLDASRYRMLLWRKLVEPLTIMAMMIFALPFAGGRLREAGAGQRLLVGILVGVVFYVVNKVSVSLGDLYGWSPPLAAGAPTVLFATIGFWRLSRMR